MGRYKVLGKDKEKVAAKSICRRITLLLLCSAMALSLTGCVTEKTRNAILDRLEKEMIILREWEQTELLYNSAAPIPGIHSYDYIYECEDEVYAVRIHSADREERYLVSVLKDVEIEETVYPRTEGEDEIYREVSTYEIQSEHYLKYQEILCFKFMKLVEPEESEEEADE